MIIAGEASGDLHAAGLLREFNHLCDGFHFFGVGGEQMAQAGCENLYSVNDVAFLGFVEVVRHLPFIRQMMNSLEQECLRRQPRALVLIDYPGFNLRFAARLRQHAELQHLPILYYISPQVWAWHASRVPQIAKLVDRMAVIFDFEVPIYESVGLKVDFVGHPLLDVIEIKKGNEALRQEYSITLDEPLLALLPGSREQEVRRLLPLFMRTASILHQNFPNLRALIGGSPSLTSSFYDEIIVRSGYGENDAQLVCGQTHELVAAADLALVASGTATLETAILGTPLIVAYRVSPLTYLIGKNMVKIPDIALVNVVAGKRIVPEFVQGAATPENLVAAATALLKDVSLRQTMIAELEIVKQKLGQPGASQRVAAILYELISGEQKGDQ